MTFWIVLGVVVALVLLAAWRMDRRSRGHGAKRIEHDHDNAAMGEAKARRYFRDMGQTGPNGRF